MYVYSLIGDDIRNIARPSEQQLSSCWLISLKLIDWRPAVAAGFAVSPVKRIAYGCQLGLHIQLATIHHSKLRCLNTFTYSF